MKSKTDKQLEALLNDTTVEVDLISRVDKYLHACCEACGCEGLPEPITRIDHLLYELVEKISHGSGGAGFVDTKKLTNLDLFCKEGINLEFGLDENLDTQNVTSMMDLYHTCTTITAVPLLNTSKCKIMQAMFYNCYSLLEIPAIDTSEATNMMYWAGNDRALKTVHLIDATNNNTFDYAFDNCNELETISFVENSIKCPLDLHWSVKLSKASLLSILKGLNLSVTGKTLKLPSVTETIITGDTELNVAYNSALTAGWNIQFI